MFSRGCSRVSRTGMNPFRWRYPCVTVSSPAVAAYHRLLSYSNPTITPPMFKYAWGSTEHTLCGFRYDARHHIHNSATSTVEDQSDPFSLVADELSILADRLRSMVVAEVPKLASAAEYFFKMGVEGKRFRPTAYWMRQVTGLRPLCLLLGVLKQVLLLMATALNMPVSVSSADRLSPASVVDNLETQLRRRQQCIAEITEMIHVASLLHDDVLDDADTRRGVSSLNSVMGNKLAVLAGDFLLSRACVALASLHNTEVVTLLAKVVEHLVTGETMQMTTTSEQRLNMQYYMDKTYFKTASLISNSCKAIALLAGQTAEAATLAYEYGKNLGLAYQLIDDVLDYTGTSASLGKGSLSDIRHGIVTAPLLFAIEEFPQLSEVVQRGLDNPADIDLALDYLGKSQGIQKAKELALKHANLAAEAIDSLPESDDEDVRRSRRALVDLTHRVINRTK
uniref:Geranyl diphosphate synthase n=1 Tax=Chenopodium quinoa TaxID=63459 RepID=A0A803MIP8_CHEQI